MIFTDYYQALMENIYNHNRDIGWWDNVDKWTVFTKLMLTVSESSEAMEGDRKNLQDDKLPHRKMLEVELADTMIRTLDLMGHQGVNIAPSLHERISFNIDAMLKNEPPVPVVLFQIVNDIVDWGRGITNGNYVVATIHAACDYLDLDLKGAIKEKREFNAIRADHKRENRQKDNGKSY